GGRTVAVHTEVADEENGARARVCVSDEGPGLSPADQAHVWERFPRIAGVAVRYSSGVSLGLGLYICKAIVEAHGGHVGVESAVGMSSTVWFTLPLVRPPGSRSGEQGHCVTRTTSQQIFDRAAYPLPLSRPSEVPTDAIVDLVPSRTPGGSLRRSEFVFAPLLLHDRSPFALLVRETHHVANLNCITSPSSGSTSRRSQEIPCPSPDLPTAHAMVE